MGDPTLALQHAPQIATPSASAHQVATPIQPADPASKRAPFSRRQYNEAVLAPSVQAQARYVTDMSCPPPYADSSSRLLHVDWERQSWVPPSAPSAHPNPGKSIDSIATGATTSRDRHNEELLLQRVTDKAHHRDPKLDLRGSPRRTDQSQTATERYKEDMLSQGQVHRSVCEWDRPAQAYNTEGWKGVYEEAVSGDTPLLTSRYNSLCDMFLAADKDRSGYLTRNEMQSLLREYLPDAEAQKMMTKMDATNDSLISYGEFSRFLRAQESDHANSRNKQNSNELISRLAIDLPHNKAPALHDSGAQTARDAKWNERKAARDFHDTTQRRRSNRHLHDYGNELRMSAQQQLLSDSDGRDGIRSDRHGGSIDACADSAPGQDGDGRWFKAAHYEAAKKQPVFYGRRAAGEQRQRRRRMSASIMADDCDAALQAGNQNNQAVDMLKTSIAVPPIKRHIQQPSLIQSTLQWTTDDAPASETNPMFGRRGGEHARRQRGHGPVQQLIRKLDEHSINGQLYKRFLQLDTDRSGYIDRKDIVHICQRFGLDDGPITKALLALDNDPANAHQGHKKLSYLDFVHKLTNADYPDEPMTVR